MPVALPHHRFNTGHRRGTEAACCDDSGRLVRNVFSPEPTTSESHGTDERHGRAYEREEKAHCCIENGLEPVQLVTRNTRQGRASVIKSHQYQ